MCVASRLLNDLKRTWNAVDEEFAKFKRLKSESDKELESFYEKVRTAGNFNVVQGYQLTKELQLILQKRRIIKEELGKIKELRREMLELNIDRTFNTLESAIVERHNRFGEDNDWFNNFRFDELPKF